MAEGRSDAELSIAGRLIGAGQAMEKGRIRSLPRQPTGGEAEEGTLEAELRAENQQVGIAVELSA